MIHQTMVQNHGYGYGYDFLRVPATAPLDLRVSEVTILELCGFKAS